jgi:hypothetical protein
MAQVAGIFFQPGWSAGIPDAQVMPALDCFHRLEISLSRHAAL